CELTVLVAISSPVVAFRAWVAEVSTRLVASLLVGSTIDGSSVIDPMLSQPAVVATILVG
ncbi:hypothetical protein, partial [Gordonia sp. NPDC003376]